MQVGGDVARNGSELRRCEAVDRWNE